jgi:polysaccharide biosynthesis protein PslH
LRPRLLFVTHFLPFPVYSGAASRTLNLILELAREFDVRVVPLFRRPQHASPDEAEEAALGMRQLGLDVSKPMPVPADWSRLRGLAVHPLSAILRRPFGTVRLANSDFRERIRSELNGRTKLIHIDTPDLAGVVDGIRDIPVVCNYHDVESPTLHRRATNAQNIALRWYLRQQAGQYEMLERTHAPLWAMNIVCSEKERRHLLRIAPSATVEVVPNGVDTDYFSPSPSPSPESPRNIVFVGGLDMEPNLDGMQFFLQSVWPHVLERIPDCTLTVVGRAPERRVAELPQRRGTEFVGRVEDVRSYMARAGCIIVPLRLGGATRLKIVHAWGMAKAIVSTSVGCEGLRARDGQNILVRDDPTEFAAAIHTVLQDATLRERIGTEGRATALAEYSWAVIGRQIRATYKGLV